MSNPMSNPITGVPCQFEVNGGEAPPSDCSRGSSNSNSSLLCGQPTSQNDPRSSQTSSPVSPNNCTSPFLEEEGLDAHKEQRSEVCVHQKPEWRTRARSSRFDSCYSTSESPGEEEEEEEEEEDEESVFQEARVWQCRSFFSDRASSGVASFDEEEERDEAEEKEEEKEFLM